MHSNHLIFEDIENLLTRSKTLRGHYGSALSHIHSGIKMLSSINRLEQGTGSESPLRLPLAPCVPIETLKVIFSRLDSQSYEVRLLRISRSGYELAKMNEASGYTADVSQPGPYYAAAWIWTPYPGLLQHPRRGPELPILPPKCLFTHRLRYR